MANLVGKTLGKYHIVERLGRGGMAEVYKAYHAKLDRHVTIKILHSYLVEGPDFLARFEREARAVATLRHPHIVQIHDYEAEDDTYYMVVEFIDGSNLQIHLDELATAGAYMPIAEVLSTLEQIASALDYAHRQGIIHRDIKPSNILLDSRGNAFLCDFGIARIVGGSQVTTTGSLIGTPAYMSPEQGLGGELSETSDIYSLGVVVYQMLTGKVPFAADTPLAIIHKQVNEPPVAPSKLRPDLPGDVDGIIERALAKKPQDRHPSAMDLYRDVQRVLTPPVIKTLDAGAAPESVPIAVAPTIRVDESGIRAPVPEAADVHKAKLAEAEAQAAAAGDAAPQRPSAPPTREQSTLASAASRRKMPVRMIAVAIAGVAVVAAAAILLTVTKPAAIAPTSPPAPAVSPTPYAWDQPAAASTARSTSTPATGIVYTEDFEDQKAQGWEIESGWKVIEEAGNYVLLGENHFWAFSNKTYRQDNQLSFRIRLERGRIHLVSHYNETGRYFVGFESYQTDFQKQIWPDRFMWGLAKSTAPHPLNTWMQVEIVSRGGTIEFYVDGQRVFTYTDPDPLAGGQFAFETQAGARAYIDDISLELLSAP